MPFLYFTLGLISVVTQSVLIRLAQVYLFHTDLGYGIFLSFWLFFSGLGCFSPKIYPFYLIPPYLFGVIYNYFFKYLKQANQAYIYETLGFCFGGLLFGLGVSRIGSPYQKVTIKHYQSQDQIFTNNRPYYSFPASEDAYVLKYLSLTSFSKVLLKANPNYAHTLSQISPQAQIDLLEVDPVLRKIGQKYLPANACFVSQPDLFPQQAGDYDLVILAQDIPRSLSDNRYYTREFFQTIKSKILIIFPYRDFAAPAYYYPIASILSALPSAKSYLVDNYLLIANYDLGLQPITFPVQANPNSRRQPQAFFLAQIYHLSSLWPKLPIIIKITALIFPLILLFFLTSKNDLKSIFGASFVSFAFNTLALYHFQEIYGSLYSQISLLLALNLFCLSLGVYLSKNFSRPPFLLFFLILVSFHPIITMIIASLTYGFCFGVLNRQPITSPYAFDSWGAALGSLIVTTVLLPIWGINYIVLFCLVLTLFLFFRSLN